VDAEELKASSKKQFKNAILRCQNFSLIGDHELATEQQ
jgi:hypothetical protein